LTFSFRQHLVITCNAMVASFWYVSVSYVVTVLKFQSVFSGAELLSLSGRK